MTRAPRWLLALVPVVAVAAGLLGPNELARAQSVRPRTLLRTEDWMVVKGLELKKFCGIHKDKIRLYAARGGVFFPIPYQIDERDRRGGYCFEEGGPERIVRDFDDGLVDENDELVFMAKDAGDLVAETSYPPGFKAAHVIELKDPVNGTEGWVYALSFDTPPPRSPKRYASVTKQKDGSVFWEGERFACDNTRSVGNACRITSLKFARPEDAIPDYSKVTSVIDCSKVTLRAKKLFVSIQRDSSDVYIEIGGYMNGPVRVVAQNIVEVNVALGFTIRAPDSLILLYGNGTTMPTNVDLPVDLSDSAGTSWYKLLMDLSPARTKGWKFYNSKNPTPVPIDGKMDTDEGKLDKAWPEWNVVYGPEGAIMNRFVLDPRMTRSTNELYYSDDVGSEEPPEFEAGNFGTFGFKVDLSGTTSGVYSGDYLTWFIAPPFNKGDEQKYVDMISRPIVTTVR